MVDERNKAIFYKSLILLLRHKRLHLYDIAFAQNITFSEAREVSEKMIKENIITKEGYFLILNREPETSKWIIITTTKNKKYYTELGFIEVKNLLVAPAAPEIQDVILGQDKESTFIAISPAAEEAWLRSYGNLTPINYMFRAEGFLIQYLYEASEGEDNRDIAKKALTELEKAHTIALKRTFPSEKELIEYVKIVEKWSSVEEVINKLKGIFKEKEKSIVDQVEKSIKVQGG